MPLYEYYCLTCDQKFEMLRPMSRADEATSCPQGHPGAQRALSLFAVPRGGTAAECGPGFCACAAGAGERGSSFGGVCAAS